MLNSKEMNGQNCTYNVIYKQVPKKKQAIFTVLGHVVEAQRLPESCQLHLQNWRSKFFNGYSSHIKYSFSATNWRCMQKSCECTWPQWQNVSSTYGHTSKISKEVSGHSGSSRLYARFTLGVRAQKTWGQLWAFLACCWSQVTNKCYNIGHQGSQIGFSNGILFSALGSTQGYKVQHLLVTWGRLKIFFLFQPWSLM